MGTCYSNQRIQKNQPNQSDFKQKSINRINLLYSKTKKTYQKKESTASQPSSNQNIFAQNRFVYEQCPSLLTFCQNKKDLDQFFILYNKAMSYFDQHQIDNSYKTMQQLQYKYKHLLNAIDPQIKSKQHKNIKRVIRDYQQIFKEGWIKKSQKNQIKVSTRDQGDTVGALMQSEIDIPFQKFLSVITEFDFFQDFMPFINQSRQIKSLQRNIKVGYSTVKLPLLAQRQSFFQGTGYNRLKQKNCIFIFSRTITNRPDLQQQIQYYPKLHENSIQIMYKYFVVKYQPIDKKRGNISMATNVDMKMSFIPNFLVDYAAQYFGNKIFQNVLKIVNNYQGSKWEQKSKKNPQFYQFISKIIKQHTQNAS